MHQNNVVIATAIATNDENKSFAYHDSKFCEFSVRCTKNVLEVLSMKNLPKLNSEKG